MNRETRKGLVSLGATIVLSVAAAPAGAQSLSEAEIQAAIDAAAQTRALTHLMSVCSAAPSWGQAFSSSMPGGLERNLTLYVTVSQNAGRIARLAMEANRLYKPFNASAVPDAVKTEPAVFVSVDPDEPYTSLADSRTTVSVSPPVERIVLRSKSDARAVVQPLTLAVEAVKWPNLLGPDIEGNRALATFSVAEVKALPAGDFDVIVITPHGERRCKVGTDDRRRLSLTK